jgi:hypothetical protein
MAGEGSLGIFEDAQATSCRLSLAPGATRTFYVVFLADGSTRGGIHGTEFQVNTRNASGYLLTNEALLVPGSNPVGNFLSGGVIIGFSECQNGATVPIARFDVTNLGGAVDAPLFLGAKSPPSAPTFFYCPLANLCDHPAYTKVCISGGVGFLNASDEVACGSGAQMKEWSRVKAFYK